MNCPVCKSTQHTAIDLHAEGFAEDICECPTCGTTWSVNHGLAEVITDSQERSFLEALTECVEGDDYALAS